MGKSKPPAGLNPAGLAAYRQVLDQKNAAPEEGGGPAAGGGKAAPAGFVKAGQGLPGKRPPPGLVKSGPVPAGRPPGGEPPEDSKFRRVAKFLILIGSEEAARVIAGLDPDQVEAVSREIASIRGISPEEAGPVLEEFRSLLSSPYGYTGASRGGVEEARRLLYAAYGPEQGEALLKKAVPEAAENLFGFLEDFSAEQLAFLFREESPAAAAMVLSRLPPALSAGVLARMPAERKLEIARRIARLGVSGTEVLERAAAALREKARHIGRSDREAATPDGMNALTAILKHSDLSFGDRLLGELEGKDPDLGRNLKERLYTLEDLINADDRPVQAKLRSLSDRDIALLLKGRSEAFRAKIFTNLSGARGEQVREEETLMGPVPKKEADAAAGEFLAWFRQGREEGKILMINSEDVIV